MCRQEPGANPADRRERGSHILRAFCRLLLLHLHHLLVILTGPSLGTVKKMSSPNTNFALRLRSFRWYAPPLGPAPVPPPTKVPYFAFRRAQPQSANRFTHSFSSTLRSKPLPHLQAAERTTKTKVEQRVTRKYQTHNIWLLSVVLVTLYATGVHWAK